jgi:hypothetical protein
MRMNINFDLRERLANYLLGDNYKQINETLAQSEFNNETLTERLAELELALEDANWMRLMLDGEREFSREGLIKIGKLARLMFIKNPWIKRAVRVKALYTWAQGINVKYKNPKLNKLLQSFWDDPKNRAELTSHQARMYKEYDLQVEGNIFFVFFTRPSDGRVRVRSIPPDEISEIISDPEDAKSPRYYVRRWTEKGVDNGGRRRTKPRVAYYPDWQYKPKTKPAKIANSSVLWDNPVFHVKIGGMSDWKFGVSEVYSAIDWARAYKEFLEDVASLMRAYSRFAWKRVTKGGKKAIAAEKAKLASTLATGGTSTETNPPAVTGAMAILGQDTDLQPMQLRGAAISAEDGRRFLLGVAAGVDLPETYFGDVSVGTLATAKAMDRPTELSMKERQTLWIDVFKQIFEYMTLQALKSQDSEIKEFGNVETTEDNGEVEEKIVWKKGVNTILDIDFPPILERDVQAAVQSVVTALTLNGQELRLLDEELATRLILKAIAEDDVDEIMTELFPDSTSSVTNTAPDGTAEPTSEALVKEATRKFLMSVMDMKKNGHKATA